MSSVSEKRDWRPSGPPSARAVVIALSLLTAVGPFAWPSGAASFSSGREAKNFSKITERESHLTSRPAFQKRLQRQNAKDTVQYPRIIAADPERDFTENLCSHRQNECAGDVRFYNWAREGHGIKHPVLFTARDGATISGAVWASKRGPRRRPGVVITTGGLAPETLYWGFAALLARHGYVVLTYDVQGQGRSDTYGQGVDRMEGRTDEVQAFAEGQPFFDGTEDALDFLESTPRHPYRPRPSCGNANGGTATDHSRKQRRRVAEGFDARYNPLWRLLDRNRIGIAGHSQGASGVSFIGQKDDRVDAFVAWDNLYAPGEQHFFAECPSNPSSRTNPPITKPALGMSADYFQPPEPYTSDPGTDSKNAGFDAYRQAGIDSMQVNIRGGTHYEFSFMAGSAATYPFGTATLRGYDLVGWYTTAWLDRYVRCQAARCKRRADRRLLTTRWRHDRREARVDPTGDGNMYSFYLRSAYALHRPDEGRVHCNDMRKGCSGMRADSLRPNYSLYRDAIGGY